MSHLNLGWPIAGKQKDEIKERWRKPEPLLEDIKGGLASLKSLFQKEVILLAYLFGSLGKGKNGEDVDLALLAQGEGVEDLRSKVWRLLGTERVDPVNLKTLGPVSRFEIIRSGTIIYKANDEVENQFEFSVLQSSKILFFDKLFQICLSEGVRPCAPTKPYDGKRVEWRWG